MARDLKLKTEWLDDKTARVSWVDNVPNYMQKGRMLANLIGGVIAVLIGLGSLLFGQFILAIFLIIAGFVAISRVFASHTVPNVVRISPDGISHGGQPIVGGKVSRVEYGKQSHWTGATLQQGTPDPMEIRLWFDNDRDFHVLSVNTWQPRVNHQIKAEIEDAIAAVKKVSQVQKHEAEHGKQGDFGMPDY